MSNTEPRESIWIRSNLLFALTSMAIDLIPFCFVVLVSGVLGWIVLVWMPGKFVWMPGK